MVENSNNIGQNPSNYTNFILMRHAQSEANTHIRPVIQSYLLKGQFIKTSVEKMVMQNLSSNLNFVDVCLSQHGRQQALNAQPQLNKINLYKKVFVSPQRRTIETAITILASHPQKENLVLVLVPIMKESLTAVECVPLPFEQTLKLLDDSGFNYDVSLFDQFEDKDTWGIEVITDQNIKHQLMEYYQQTDNSMADALLRFFQEHQTFPENDQLSLQRCNQLKEFLNQEFLQVTDPDQKVLVVGHGIILKGMTSTNLVAKKVKANGERVEYCLGLGMRGSMYMANCVPTNFHMEWDKKKWRKGEPKKAKSQTCHIF